jgi:hypothetical protein
MSLEATISNIDPPSSYAMSWILLTGNLSVKDRQVKCETDVWPLRRALLPHNGRAQAPAAVVGHDFWTRASLSILGCSARASSSIGCQWTIVHVTPPGIAGVVIGSQ